MNSANDPEQIEDGRAQSARNVTLGKQTLRGRRGHKKAHEVPVWGRSLSLDGLKTGIVGSRLPEGTHVHWDDADGADKTRLTFQIRTQPVDLDSIGESEIPYSLDYNGDHEMPDETLVSTIYQRHTLPMGYESLDPLLWKPNGSNRYDTTVGKKYPWLPGIDTLTIAEADNVRPKFACIWGTGPLREFPLWQRDQSQKRAVDGGLLATSSTFGKPAPAMDSDNVDVGDFDAGDLYLFWVYSPITASWYLMFLWEYSDPGETGVPHVQGMNRYYAFSGWGANTDNIAAMPVDPTVPHTITCTFMRRYEDTASSDMQILVDDPFDGNPATATDTYGYVLQEPLPGGGPAVGPANAGSAPTFGVKELFGDGGVRNGWRGRTMYLGGLPKMSNQRGAWGYGVGRSSTPGGMTGITCPYPGRLSELRLYCGALDTVGANRDWATTSMLMPFDSRTIKRHAAGAAWDYGTDPTVVKYTGCINIWRLLEESGDVFDPLYTFAGSSADDSFWSGGKPAGLLQDFHPFEPISNGALVAPPTLLGSDGGMRFNGGSPAFSMQGALFRHARGESVGSAGDVPATGTMRSPNQFGWGLTYKVHTAPCLEPSSAAGPSGDIPYPKLTEPGQGEVHTLLQLMAPVRQGKDDDTVLDGVTITTDDLGQTEGRTVGFDHPSTVAEGTAATDHPPGRKALECGRVDLVCHYVDIDGLGTMKRRYVMRADFGYGATNDDFTDFADPEEAAQQLGNERMFRSSIDIAAPGANEQPDVGDNYFHTNFSSDRDDRYCYVTLANAGGAAYENPDDIEGRVFAVYAGYSSNPESSPASKVVGNQVLRVWDITVPAAAFEVTPTGANEHRKIAEVGMSFGITSLFGTDKYLLSLGGKIEPGDSQWWVGEGAGVDDRFHFPGQNGDTYPKGCWAISNTPDQKGDRRSIGCSAGMIFNGAKGQVDFASVFHDNLNVTTAREFFYAISKETTLWGGHVPEAARAFVDDELKAAWICDVDGGPIVIDDAGGLHLGLDDLISAVAPSGTEYQWVNLEGGGSSKTFDHDYTYNRGTRSSMFPSALIPVRNVNTGRYDTLYTEEFSDTVVVAALGASELPNVDPSKETLLACLGHLRASKKTDILVVSKTAVLRYDDAGAGSLTRVGPLPQHFSDQHVVSRDVSAERTVLTNGAANPVILGADSRPRQTEFLNPPIYGVPVIWARTWTLAENNAGEVPDASEWPFVFKVAYETVYPSSRSVIGIERVEASTGLRWTGEMPSLINDPVGQSGWGFTIEGLARTPPTDIVNWRFFFTYWSERLQVESFPGRVFTWANALPFRPPVAGSTDLGANSVFTPVPDNRYTGLPANHGLVLVMRGQTPLNATEILPDTAGVSGTPKTYNLRIRNVPLSPDPDVSHLRVYRTTANGDVFFLEQEIAMVGGAGSKDDRITVTVGTKADYELSVPFVSGVASRVPVGAKFTCAFQGRVFYAGFPDRPYRIMFSYVDQPGAVPFFYFVDLVSGGSGPITGLYADDNRVWAHKETGVYVGIVRDFDIYGLEQASAGLPVSFDMLKQSVGMAGDRCIATIPERGTVFAGDSSVWLQQGTQFVRASVPIDGETADDLVETTDPAPLAEQRLLYPFAWDSTRRDRWIAIWNEHNRQVLFFGGPGDPVWVLHPDLMEWSFYTGWDFDDVTVVNRIGSAALEMFGVRDSRLWLIDSGYSDGLDYSSEDLDGEALVSGATDLSTGTISVVNSTTDIKLSLLTASLPAAYAAILNPTSIQKVEGDLLRSTVIRISGSGVSAQSKIDYAFDDAGNVRVFLETPIAGMVAGMTFWLGDIPTHWVSNFIQPSDGLLTAEGQRLEVRRKDLKVTLDGAEHRASPSFYWRFRETWPELADLLFKFSSPTQRRLHMTNVRGRGHGFVVAVSSEGAYAPLELTSGSILSNVLGDMGRVDGG